MDAVDHRIGGHRQFVLLADGMVDNGEAGAKPEPLVLGKVAYVPLLSVVHITRIIACGIGGCWSCPPLPPTSPVLSSPRGVSLSLFLRVLEGQVTFGQ